ncbi:MAG: twin-arginine translocase TatA/TatE family subunit [Planctomycetota bacterium]|nr:twin-arginine translocase TatA/TatE family subunit [Planctomycetota bacterium]
MNYLNCSLLGFGFGGPMDMVIILIVCLLLFGNRLPSVMRNLGSGAREFKKGVEGIDEEMREAEKTVVKETDKAVAKDEKKE